jgi:GAF domain-containing protein
VESQLLRLLEETSAALSEADSTESALAQAVTLICRRAGWPVGHVYLPAKDAPGEFISSEFWHLEGPERFDTFRAVTSATRFSPGVGVIGRVLATRAPTWVPDVTSDPQFVRAHVERDIGVRAGVMLPVPVGRDLAGVLEFFSPDAVPPDPALLDAMALVGMQVGVCLARVRAERRVVLEDLASAVSHAVNSPLLAARNALELLEEDLAEGQTSSPFLGIARDELARVAEVMRRLRHIAGACGETAAVHELDQLLSA